MADSGIDRLAAMTGGDQRLALEAIRDQLAEELAGERTLCVKCGGAVGATPHAVAKQLVAVIADLEELAEPEGSALDELAAAREARRATVPDAPAADKQRGAGGGRARGKRGSAS